MHTLPHWLPDCRNVGSISITSKCKNYEDFNSLIKSTRHRCVKGDLLMLCISFITIIIVVFIVCVSRTRLTRSFSVKNCLIHNYYHSMYQSMKERQFIKYWWHIFIYIDSSSFIPKTKCSACLCLCVKVRRDIVLWSNSFFYNPSPENNRHEKLLHFPYFRQSYTFYQSQFKCRTREIFMAFHFGPPKLL